jgi:hypothetical protein
LSVGMMGIWVRAMGGIVHRHMGGDGLERGVVLDCGFGLFGLLMWPSSEKV